jgi:hypothetical protein
VSKSWQRGSTRAWRRIRAAVLAANRAHNAGRCTLRIDKVCTGWADCVHHVLGRRATGDDPRHLVAACGACNRSVGDPARHDPEPRPITRW